MAWDILGTLPGKTFEDWMEGEIRCLVRRGTGSYCGYVGVPWRHRKAGFGYQDMPLRCHWGLTFADRGGQSGFPAGWYWYGWDYAHSGDDVAFYYEPPLCDDPEIQKLHSGENSWGINPAILLGKQWSLPEVRAEVVEVAHQLERLSMKRLKGIRRRYWGKTDPRPKERAKANAMVVDGIKFLNKLSARREVDEVIAANRLKP